MKRLTVMILTLALLAGLTLSGSAAQEPLTMSNATASQGQTVYLTVKLNESVVGDTVSISYQYDTELLRAVRKSCSWAREGILQDFNYTKAGVWASLTAEDLKGDLCTLAFVLRSDVSFVSTQVSCTVMVRNGATDVGTYEATGTITYSCEHQFGSWESVDGNLIHTHTCSACGARESQSHSWDDGETSVDPTNPHLENTTYTCTVCGAVRVTQNTLIPEVTEPVQTIPGPTEPTMPSAPTDPTEKPVSPTEPESPTAPTQERDEPIWDTKPVTDSTEPNTDTKPDWATEPDDDHNGLTPTEDQNQGTAIWPTIGGNTDNGSDSDDHGHDHATNPSISLEDLDKVMDSGDTARNLILVLLIVGVLVSAAVYFVKKKS